MLARLSLLTGAALITGCMQVQGPEPTVRQAATAPGTPVVLGNYAFWNKDCEAQTTTISVSEEPLNGTIEISDGVYEVPEKVRIGDSGPCVGKLVDSQKVIFRPAVGFTGKDSVSLVVSGHRGSVQDRYAITVQ
jgi:hypothetical protein